MELGSQRQRQGKGARALRIAVTFQMKDPNWGRLDFRRTWPVDLLFDHGRFSGAEVHRYGIVVLQCI